MLDFFKDKRELTLLMAIALLFIAIVMSRSLSVSDLFIIYNSSQILMLLAIGATFVIITRNIDVSVGSTMGLSAVVCGTLMVHGSSVFVAILMALVVGLLCGIFNGIVVAVLRIPAIVATLGTLGLYKGIMLLITQGKWIEDLPNTIKVLSYNLLPNVNISGLFTLMMGILFYLLLSRSAHGRKFYAVGDNLQGARLMGVKTEQTIILAFAINGMMAAMAGMVFASQIGFIPNSTGNGMEMKAIAACVLGGISLLGGVGSLWGAILGAYFLTQIDTILVLLKFPAYWNNFIAGLIVIMVIVLDGRLRMMVQESIKAKKYSRFIHGGDQ
ncbi:autoinducer 2 ABC transporter permease LsrC [Celerinatantimonas yamalensis]|uniref:Autoinducer 2 import system permease protein LsrC n=1 Tax=Celerinatantimonas yamalensis TaxID=559956 RepID=A0ABW9GAA7_9GAMM